MITVGDRIIRCPECRSASVVKNGKHPSIAKRKVTMVQNYLCKNCLRQFREHKKQEGGKG